MLFLLYALMYRPRILIQGDDEQLMKTIHLANVACGFHASYEPMYTCPQLDHLP